MNPFLILAGPSLLINVLVIALWKGYSFTQRFEILRRFHRAVALTLSLLIVFLMTWVVSFLAMIIFTTSLLDPHSSPQLFARVVREMYTYASSLMSKGWFSGQILFLLVPIALAAGATLLQRVLCTFLPRSTRPSHAS